MKLWSDEIEQMRPEARTVVAAAMAAVAEAFTGQGEPPEDLHERDQVWRVERMPDHDPSCEGRARLDVGRQQSGTRR